LLLALVFLATGSAFAQMGTAQPVDGMVSFSTVANVLSAENGTEVVVSPGGISAERLIDGNARAGWRSASGFVEGQPVEIILQLPSIMPLASLLIQPQNAAPGAVNPHELELLATTDEQSQGFESIGRYSLQAGAGWQLIKFSPVNVVLLKIRIHSVYGSGSAGIGELAAFGPGVDPRAPIDRSTDQDIFGSVNLKVSLLSATLDTRIEGMSASPGKLLVAATLEFINTIPGRPLTTRVADYLVLVEDGHYVFEHHADTARYAPAFDEQHEYLPGIPVTGTVLFEAPNDSAYMELAYLLPLRPIRLELTPALTRPPEPGILAVSNSDGELITYLYKVERLGQTRGLKLDIGLRLNTPDASLVWQLKPTEDFLLFDRKGRSYRAGAGLKLRRPFGQAVIRYGLVSRGEIEFPDAPVSDDYTLSLPLENGNVVTLLPPPPPAHLARTRAPYEQPEVTSPQAEQSPLPEVVARKQAEKPSHPIPPPAPAQAPGPHPIKGIPDVLNTGLLSIRGKLLPLYGVEGVYEPHVASLVAFIHDREVECKPEGDESYRCILAGADLSEVILANGAAKVKPDAPEHLKAAESKAREAAKGVWQ
jgi:hypothetical protein